MKQAEIGDQQEKIFSIINDDINEGGGKAPNFNLYDMK